MNNDLKSRLYRPDPAQCCEKCVFGCGTHAPFCRVEETLALEYSFDADAYTAAINGAIYYALFGHRGEC